MAGEADDIVIEIPSDDKPVTEKPVPEPAPVIVPETPDDGLADLQAQLAEARREKAAESLRATEADRLRQHAEARATELESEGMSSQQAAITAALETVKGETRRLNELKVRALASQDYAGAADIDIALIDLRAEHRILENGKQAVSSRIEERTAEPQPQLSPDQAWGRYVAQFRTPEDRAWIEAHRVEITGPEGDQFQKAMYAADTLAQRKGYKPASQDYYGFIEDQLGLTTVTETPPAKPQAQARNAPVAAPVARGSSNPVRQGVPSAGVTLTAAERAIIREMNGFSDRTAPEDIRKAEIEYAKGKQELLREDHAQYGKGI